MGHSYLDELLDKAFNDGWEAFYEGEENPYNSTQPDLFDEWEAGFIAAEDDYIWGAE